MALPKTYSIWLTVDYNGIEKLFGINRKDVINIENGGVTKWFFRMEALRNSSEESCLGSMIRQNLKKNSYDKTLQN